VTLQEHLRRGWKDAAGCDFSDWDFRGYSFVGANLEGAKLDESNFSACDLQKAVLTNASAKDCDFEAADFPRAVLRQTNLGNSNLRKARFCTYKNDRFMSAAVDQVSFAGCDLSGAIFVQELPKGVTDVGRCRVTDCDFSNSDMSNCDLQGMDFRTCQFAETSLFGTSLQRCNFEGVDLSSANLINANLSQVVYSDSSKFPDGYVLPADAKNADVARRAAKEADARRREADEEAGRVIKQIVIVLTCIVVFVIIATVVSNLLASGRKGQSHGDSPNLDSPVSDSPVTSPTDATTPKTTRRSVEPTSAPRELITNSIGMQLKLIPAGEFLMGAAADENDRDADEGPQHRVLITKPFYMGLTEVTQGQWIAVMDTMPWKGKPTVQAGNDYPAVYVSWDDAVEFCTKLSMRDGQTYRLPTEAEWEYACRGGTTTAYSFGNNATNLSDYAWWQGDSSNGSTKAERYAHQVGTKKANPFGLYDMHGNLWEWRADVYAPTAYRYRRSITVDPLLSSGLEYRVLRGGSWVNDFGHARSANRGWGLPYVCNFINGFRVVR